MRKLFVFTFISLLTFSCRKYDRPFISFKSPEKRLLNKTWVCKKVVDQNGNEFEITDRIKFEIIGSDSIFTRMTNYQPLNVLNYTNQIDTVVGTWTWQYALKGKRDKQRIRVVYPGASRVLFVNTLKSKEFEYIDESYSNSVYTYTKD